MLKIEAIPAFSDNYIWAIIGPGRQLALVDPGDAKVCQTYIDQHQLDLKHILITHRHLDHIGGLAHFSTKEEVDVYGPLLNDVTHCLADGDRITLFDQALVLHVMAIPGHTNEHIAYYNDRLIFCGDTLFSGGCGRISDNDAQTLFASLNKINQLDGDTLIYCAHEYTLNNLKFAHHVLPHDKIIAEALAHTTTLRENHKITLPSTLSEQRQFNPFLRCHEPQIIAHLATMHADIKSPLDAFRFLRQLKDEF